MIKKRTITPKAIVFGTDSIANKYAYAHEVNRAEVVLATHPELLEGLSDDVVLDVVRVPPEAWKPPTFPDEARVRETEEKLMDFHGRGGKSQLVELDV